MARRLRGPTPGFTILELLFVLAIAGTLTTIAVPQGWRALDDFRTRAAARYLAQRLVEARLGAIKRSLAQGFRFEAATPDAWGRSSWRSEDPEAARTFRRCEIPLTPHGDSASTADAGCFTADFPHRLSIVPTSVDARRAG